jgi:phosphohistidine phosphatase
MKHLFLMRHGEASFSADSDFERTLTSRGREKIARIAKSFNENTPEIDFMYCSSASRTQETAKIFSETVLIKKQEFTRIIYDGDMRDLMDLVENCSDEFDRLLIVGHNPVISMLASSLCDGIYRNMQPGDLISIQIPLESWNSVTFGSGILLEIMS